MTYAFMKYWVEGEPKAVHTLFDAFTDNGGWARDTLEKLGVNVDDYDTERAEWHDAKVENKDGYSVLYFEEEYPYERGTLIDQLMDEDMFKDKLTNLYYYAEELANSNLCETNDADGKYFPNRLMAGVIDDFGCYVDDEPVYMKDEQALIIFLREKYRLPLSLKNLEDIKTYFEESDRYEYLFVQDINVV